MNNRLHEQGGGLKLTTGWRSCFVGTFHARQILRTRLTGEAGNFQDDRRLHFGWRGRAVRRQTGGKIHT